MMVFDADGKLFTSYAYAEERSHWHTMRKEISFFLPIIYLKTFLSLRARHENQIDVTVKQQRSLERARKE